MSASVIIGLVGIGFLLIGIFSRMPIAWLLGLIGIAGTWAISKDFLAAVSLAGTVPFSSCASYVMSTIPMYVLMGNLLQRSGTSALLYRGVFTMLGNVRGGVATVTIVTSGILAAVTGSSVANAATMANVAWPEMKKMKYDPSFGTSLIAAGGTLGILIPPSTGFILYGVLSDQSIGKLFIAGLLPGILMLVLMIVIAQIMIMKNPSLAPGKPEYEKATLKGTLLSIVGILPMLSIFIIVIGGIYTGLVTPTEGGGIGAILSLICLLIFGKNKKIALWESLKSSVRTTCFIFAIVFSAMIFGYFIALSQLPQIMANMLLQSNIPGIAVLAMVMLIFAVFGMFIDATALIVLLVPISLPIVSALGYDLIMWGVLVVVLAELGLITPPVGMNCYVISGAIPDVPLSTIFKGVWPWLIAMVLTVICVVSFPELALWLPGIMMGH